MITSTDGMNGNACTNTTRGSPDAPNHHVDRPIVREVLTTAASPSITATQPTTKVIRHAGVSCPLRSTVTPGSAADSPAAGSNGAPAPYTATPMAAGSKAAGSASPKAGGGGNEVIAEAA